MVINDHSFLVLLISIFRISRSRSRSGRNERALEILRMCGQWSVMTIGRPCALSFRDLVYFFSFFFLRLGNLEPRFKFQRASRPKEEDRRGLDKLSRRGAAANGFSFFGSCLGPKNGKSLLLLCHYARFRVSSSNSSSSSSSSSSIYGRCEFRPNVQSSWANGQSRFFN